MATIYGGRWRVIDEPPREGGQGHVFVVVDTANSGTEVRFALKRLKNAKDPARLARFQREVEVLRELEHPNIVKVHDRGTQDRHEYFVMDYYPSGSLERHVDRISQDPVRALGLFSRICGAIDAAHEKGIVHRDIKPENVLLRDDGEPIVTDFGLCHVREGDRHTQLKEAVGARWYMAPELANGRAEPDAITPRSDIYSLGKLLYFLLTGDIFDREAHRQPAFDLVGRTHNPLLAHVNRILDKSVALDPADRYPDAERMGADAQAAADLIFGRYPVVTPEGGQRCTFCGVGKYELRNRDFVEYARYQGQEWRFLVCSACGHLQQFRIERAAHKSDWWGA